MSSGANAAGQVLIPEHFTGSQPLRATLERLVVGEARESSGAGNDDGDTTRSAQLPNLQVYVGDLRIGTRALGAVDLQGDARAAGHSLRQRDGPRRIGARRGAGRMA